VLIHSEIRRGDRMDRGGWIFILQNG
jgi:hypothetical protein